MWLWRSVPRLTRNETPACVHWPALTVTWNQDEKITKKKPKMSPLSITNARLADTTTKQNVFLQIYGCLWDTSGRFSAKPKNISGRYFRLKSGHREEEIRSNWHFTITTLSWNRNSAVILRTMCWWWVCWECWLVDVENDVNMSSKDERVYFEQCMMYMKTIA